VGATTVSEKASVAARLPPTPNQPIANLNETLTAGLRDDVIILDARNTAIDTLELGAYICGLINAQQPNSLIVIRNVLPPTNNPNSLRERLEMRLRQELDRCIPRLELPRLELTRVDDEQIAVLQVPGKLAPVALCDGQAYIWTNRFLRRLSIHDVYELYHAYMHTSEAGGRVQMLYGEVGWPIQPSEAIEVDNGVAQTSDNVEYDVQRHARAWQTAVFEPESDTNWLRCELTAPLRDALIRVADNNTITSIAPILRGMLLVRFNNLLASGLEITPHMPDGVEPAHDSSSTAGTTTNSNKDWFRHLPIYKSTNIRLEVKMYTQELFKRRSRMSRLHFRVPDVSLDQERVADIRQACADLGFQIYEVKETKLSNGVTSWALLKGIRNKGFCDIRLFVGIVRSNPQELTRELRYRQRTDSKTVHASLLDVGVWLWGSGDTVAAEIASLHIGLYDILSQRLHHLRTE
jgi:hypothetical protein